MNGSHPSGNGGVLRILHPFCSFSLACAGARCRLPWPCVMLRAPQGLVSTVGNARAESASRKQQLLNDKSRSKDLKQQVKAPNVKQIISFLSLFSSLIKGVKRLFALAGPMSRDLLDTGGAAAYLGLHKNTLERWRTVNQGPPFIRIGLKKVRYDPMDLAAWREQGRRVPATMKPDEARA